MALSWSEKARFYQSLQNYVKAGIALKPALLTLADENRRFRSLCNRLLRSMDEGANFADSMVASGRKNFDQMETTVAGASEQSGRLESGFRYLADYFEKMEEARKAIVRGVMYPIFLLHFGVLVLGLPELINGNLQSYLQKTFLALGMFYATGIFLAMLWKILRDLATESMVFDRLLRWIPLVGGWWKGSTVSRFLSAFEMQLQAGIPPLTGIEVAAVVSRSGWLESASKDLVKGLENGSDLADQLPKLQGALPPGVVRGLITARHTGDLDTELSRWANYYHADSLARLTTLSFWIPKLIYLGIAGYIAYRIVQTYAGALKQVEDVIKF